MGAMTFGLASAGLAMMQGISSAEARRLDARKQASFMEAQAANTRARGEAEQRRAEIEAASIERRKSQLRREYQQTASHGRSVLGAGNVALDSGSALDAQIGDINNFAADIGENAYEKALRRWEGQNANINAQNEANNTLAQASWLKNSAGTIGSSLLTGALTAIPAFAQSYNLAGGKFSSLFKR